VQVNVADGPEAKTILPEFTAETVVSGMLGPEMLSVVRRFDVPAATLQDELVHVETV
jgi:hypothetical protein